MNPILYVWGAIISLLYIAYDVCICEQSGQSNVITGGSSFRSYCFPKDSKFKLQPQQKFVATYMDPAKKHRALLLIHKIGSGKTCSAIQIANKYVGKRHRPLILMPASLIPGFYAEARSPCSGLKMVEKDAMNVVVDKTYNVMSYNKFFTNPPADASCLIVDEVQNVDNIKGNIFKKIMKWVEKHPKCPVVVMTATPIFDSPEELRGIAMIMRLPGATDGLITPGGIRKMFAGAVSVYEGAPSYTFPEVKLKIKRCPMSTHQGGWYKKQVEAERTRAGTIKLTATADNFYIKSRQKSNVVYPNGVTSSEFKRAHVDKLDVYSCKVAALCGSLRKGKLAFIYSSFTGAYGIGFLSMVLQKQGWKPFSSGAGKRRFAIWSGEQTSREKDRIREVFNSVENDDGSQLQIIIGSPAIKEGVSLFRVRQVHILEAYWNHSRLEQIYGRAVRYCSHKRLQAGDRNVTIYIYCATLGRGRPIPEESIDLYMLHMADEKRKEARPYLEALKQCAVDKNKYDLK